MASSTGPTWRHGPHHGAQHSTMTGRGLARTSASNTASVTTLTELISFCSCLLSLRRGDGPGRRYIRARAIDGVQVQRQAGRPAAVLADLDETAQPTALPGQLAELVVE